MSNDKIKPGDLYKVITVAGREFEIRYMDCGEFDPEQKGEVMPDFPYFEEEPEYTDDRYPFANRINDCCEHYKTGAERPDRTCQDCFYFKDAVEEIGVCRCTARRKRLEPTQSGKRMRIAIIGNLPTAEKIVREAYGNVQIAHFERGSDYAFVPEKFDLVLVKSYEGEGLGLMGLACNYPVDGEYITVPVRLLDEPPCRSAEAELATLIKLTISSKVNQ